LSEALPRGEGMADVLRLPVRRGPEGFSEPLVDAITLAGHLGVTDRTIRRWTAAGMPSIKRRNGTRRYRISECEAWLTVH
jgi:hypothetical protein